MLITIHKETDGLWYKRDMLLQHVELKHTRLTDRHTNCNSCDNKQGIAEHSISPRHELATFLGILIITSASSILILAKVATSKSTTFTNTRLRSIDNSNMARNQPAINKVRDKNIVAPFFPFMV